VVYSNISRIHRKNFVYSRNLRMEIKNYFQRRIITCLVGMIINAETVENIHHPGVGIHQHHVLAKLLELNAFG